MGDDQKTWEDFSERAKRIDGDIVRGKAIIVAPYLDGILWAGDELVALRSIVKRLRSIPDDGLFHHRLGIDGCFGVLDRMAICRLLKDHIAGTPPVDRTEEESPRRRAALKTKAGSGSESRGSDK